MEIQNENNRADQACNEYHATCRRIQNDFAAASFLCRIGFLDHVTPPADQRPGARFVPSLD